MVRRSTQLHGVVGKRFDAERVRGRRRRLVEAWAKTAWLNTSYGELTFLPTLSPFFFFVDTWSGTNERDTSRQTDGCIYLSIVSFAFHAFRASIYMPFTLTKSPLFLATDSKPKMRKRQTVGLSSRASPTLAPAAATGLEKVLHNTTDLKHSRLFSQCGYLVPIS